MAPLILLPKAIIIIIKSCDEGAVDRRADEQPKKSTSGMPNAQQRGNKVKKSRNEMCRPDFSSFSLVRIQVAWCCVAENEGENVQVSWRGKFF